MSPKRENRNADEGGAHASAHAQHPNAHAVGCVHECAYRLARDCGGDILPHIVELGNKALANVSNPNLEFIEIGAGACAWTIPVLARNKVTGEWAVGKNLIWTDADKEHDAGFYWSGGVYFIHEQDAREEFRERAVQVLWHREARE